MNRVPGVRGRSLRPIATALYLFLLYAVGVAHWAYLLWPARFCVLDWLLEARYYAVLREALTRHTIPYLMTYAGHYSDRFLALPETPLAPQYILLPYVSDAAFHYANTILLYTIGVLGLLWARREYRLGILPFTFLFLLFHFNGYLTAHLAVGHLMWYGYYWLPCFYILAIRLMRPQASYRTQVALVFVLFAMLLHGSFHLFMWCEMFLAFLLLFNPDRWRPLAFVLGASILLNAFRLLPGSLAINVSAMRFAGGYPSPVLLLDALAMLRDFRHSISLGMFGETTLVYWWELDCFVGMIGLGVLFYFGILRWRTSHRFRPFAFPCAMMFVLSLGATYSLATELGVPFAETQRLSTRFIVVPLVFLMLAAAIEMEAFLHEPNRAPAWPVFLTLCSLLLAAELYRHSSMWRVPDIEAAPALARMEPAISAGIRAPNWGDSDFRYYALTVWASWGVSAGTALYLLWTVLLRGRFTTAERS